MMWSTHKLLVIPFFISLTFTIFIPLKVNGEGVDKNDKQIDFMDEHNDYEEDKAILEDQNNIDTEDEQEEESNLFFGQASLNLHGDSNDGSNNSMITIIHKIYSDNITRHGVTTIPSSLIVSIIKTALGPMSGETVLALGLGMLLPVLMISMPFMMTMAMASLLVMIVLMMTGVFTSTLVFMPFSLVMFGLYVAMDTDLHDFIGEKMSNLPSLEEMEKIGKAISEAMENIEVAEENEDFKHNDYSVPRVLFKSR